MYKRSISAQNIINQTRKYAKNLTGDDDDDDDDSNETKTTTDTTNCIEIDERVYLQ